MRSALYKSFIYPMAAPPIRHLHKHNLVSCTMRSSAFALKPFVEILEHR